MFNYSKITNHTKSNSHSITKPITTITKHKTLNKRQFPTTSSTSPSISTFVKHLTTSSLSKSYCSNNNISHNSYLKYYYPKYTTSSSINKHLRHNSSNTNVTNKTPKHNLNTNQSLNMSRHNKHIKTNTHDDCSSLIINTSMSVNTTSNDVNNNNNNNGVVSNINKRKQILTIPSKKEQPTKLYTEPNNSGGPYSCECSRVLESFINDLECKLQLKLAQIKTNSKSSKYNVIKSIFDELIQGNNNNSSNVDIHLQKLQPLLTKILKGCTEVVLSYASENRIIKEKHEICQNKFLQCDKENIELRKRLKEKNNEIEKLKKKINELTTTSNNKQEHSHQSNKSTDASSHKHKHSNIEKIEYLNTHNITDLDALYFYDKVKMNSDNDYSRLNDNQHNNTIMNVVVPALNLQFNYEDVGEHNKLGGGDKANNNNKQIKITKKGFTTKKLTNTKSLGNVQHINVFK